MKASSNGRLIPVDKSYEGLRGVTELPSVWLRTLGLEEEDPTKWGWAEISLFEDSETWPSSKAGAWSTAEELVSKVNLTYQVQSPTTASDGGGGQGRPRAAIAAVFNKVLSADMSKGDDAAEWRRVGKTIATALPLAKKQPVMQVAESVPVSPTDEPVFLFDLKTSKKLALRIGKKPRVKPKALQSAGPMLRAHTISGAVARKPHLLFIRMIVAVPVSGQEQRVKLAVRLLAQTSSLPRTQRATVQPTSTAGATGWPTSTAGATGWPTSTAGATGWPTSTAELALAAALRPGIPSRAAIRPSGGIAEASARGVSKAPRLALASPRLQAAGAGRSVGTTREIVEIVMLTVRARVSSRGGAGGGGGRHERSSQVPSAEPEAIVAKSRGQEPGLLLLGLGDATGKPHDDPTPGHPHPQPQPQPQPQPREADHGAVLSLSQLEHMSRSAGHSVQPLEAERAFRPAWSPSERKALSRRNAARLLGPKVPVGGFLALQDSEEEVLAAEAEAVETGGRHGVSRATAVPLEAFRALSSLGALKGPVQAPLEAVLAEGVLEDLEFAREVRTAMEQALEGVHVAGLRELASGTWLYSAGKHADRVSYAEAKARAGGVHFALQLHLTGEQANRVTWWLRAQRRDRVQLLVEVTLSDGGKRSLRCVTMFTQALPSLGSAAATAGRGGGISGEQEPHQALVLSVHEEACRELQNGLKRAGRRCAVTLLQPPMPVTHRARRLLSYVVEQAILEADGAGLLLDSEGALSECSFSDGSSSGGTTDDNTPDEGDDEDGGRDTGRRRSSSAVGSRRLAVRGSCGSRAGTAQGLCEPDSQRPALRLDPAVARALTHLHRRRSDFGAIYAPPEALRRWVMDVVLPRLRPVLQPEPNLGIGPSAYSHGIDRLAAEAKRALLTTKTIGSGRQLNREQLAAIGMVFRRLPLVLLSGPPGTGKTTTLSALLAHLLACPSQPRVLVLSQSNVAVELVLRKTRMRLLLMLGDGLQMEGGRSEAAGEGGTEEEDAFGAAGLCRRLPIDDDILRVVSQSRDMGSTAREQGWDVAKEIREVAACGPTNLRVMAKKRLVVATLDTAAKLAFDAANAAALGSDARFDVHAADAMRALDFDYVVVDEASQARQAQLLPVLMATCSLARGGQQKPPTLVLAGDPHQLGPVIQDRLAELAGAGVPLIERLLGADALPSVGVGRSVAAEVLRGAAVVAGARVDVDAELAEALPVDSREEAKHWEGAATLVPEVKAGATSMKASSAGGRGAASGRALKGPGRSSLKGGPIPDIRVVQLTQSFRAVPQLTALWSESTYDGAVMPVRFVGADFGAAPSTASTALEPEVHEQLKCAKVQEALGAVEGGRGDGSGAVRHEGISEEELKEVEAEIERLCNAEEIGSSPTTRGGTGADAATVGPVAASGVGADQMMLEAKSAGAGMLLFMAGKWPQAARRALRAVKRAQSESSAEPAVPARRSMLVIAVDGVMESQRGSSSLSNTQEVDRVCDVVEAVLGADSMSSLGIGLIGGAGAEGGIAEAGSGYDDIVPSVAVVSPYSAQQAAVTQGLEARLGEEAAGEVRVGTVDGVQGTEADLVVISTVRSSRTAGRCAPADGLDEVFGVSYGSSEGLAGAGGSTSPGRDDVPLGFLKNPRRTNVAISRAKFGLVIVCDPRALSSDPHWATTVAFAACTGGLIAAEGTELALGVKATRHASARAAALQQAAMAMAGKGASSSAWGRAAMAGTARRTDRSKRRAVTKAVDPTAPPAEGKALLEGNSHSVERERIPPSGPLGAASSGYATSSTPMPDACEDLQGEGTWSRLITAAGSLGPPSLGASSGQSGDAGVGDASSGDSSNPQAEARALCYRLLWLVALQNGGEASLSQLHTGCKPKGTSDFWRSMQVWQPDAKHTDKVLMTTAFKAIENAGLLEWTGKGRVRACRPRRLPEWKLLAETLVERDIARWMTVEDFAEGYQGLFPGRSFSRDVQSSLRGEWTAGALLQSAAEDGLLLQEGSGESAMWLALGPGVPPKTRVLRPAPGVVELPVAGSQGTGKDGASGSTAASRGGKLRGDSAPQSSGWQQVLAAALGPAQERSMVPGVQPSRGFGDDGPGHRQASVAAVTSAVGPRGAWAGRGGALGFTERGASAQQRPGSDGAREAEREAPLAAAAGSMQQPDWAAVVLGVMARLGAGQVAVPVSAIARRYEEDVGIDLETAMRLSGSETGGLLGVLDALEGRWQVVRGAGGAGREERWALA